MSEKRAARGERRGETWMYREMRFNTTDRMNVPMRTGDG